MSPSDDVNYILHEITMPLHRIWHHMQFYQHSPTSAETSNEVHETYAWQYISKARYEIRLIYNFHVYSMFI